MPLVLMSGALFSWIGLSRKTEWVLLAVSASIGLTGCLMSLRRHRDFTPLSLLLAGVLLTLGARLGNSMLGLFLTMTLVVAGPLMMAYALWLDRRCCGCACASGSL